ncbi:MAG TPA: hypothetical protein VL979_15105 [Solirubrobacteraceae bacterium]|nr:hypothetical protein [Solirubrobacteraceae bacterium]
MVKAGLILSCVVMALVVSAIVSVAAYAEPTKECEPEVFTVCIEKTQGEGLLSVEETASYTGSKATGTTARLAASGLASIECERAAATGRFTAPEAKKGTEILKLAIAFESCRDTTSEESCAIKEPLATKELKGTFSSAEEATDVTLAPASGTEFESVTITSKSGHTCGAAGTYKVTGEKLCTLAEFEAATISHQLVCHAEEKESKLKFGEKSAEWELTEALALSEALKELPWVLMKTPALFFRQPTGTYPVTVEGRITGAELEFKAGGAQRAKCKTATLTSGAIGAPTQWIRLTLAVSECGTSTVTVAAGCGLIFFNMHLGGVLQRTYIGALHIAGPGCTITVLQMNNCEVVYGEQIQASGVEALNFGPRTGIEMLGNFTGMSYTATNCGALNGTDGAMIGEWKEEKQGGGAGLIIE